MQSEHLLGREVVGFRSHARQHTIVWKSMRDLERPVATRVSYLHRSTGRPSPRCACDCSVLFGAVISDVNAAEPSSRNLGRNDAKDQSDHETEYHKAKEVANECDNKVKR